jgi:hypothetical protein
MYYGYYPYERWPSPWGPPMGMGYPMMGGWGSPYGAMGPMPYNPPWGAFGTSGMPPYGPSMTGGFGTPGMPPYGQPNYPPPGGFGTPGMPPYGPPMAPEQEIEFLRSQAQMLKDQLDQIDARIQELEKQSR